MQKEDTILQVLSKYGITNNVVQLWGTGKPLREFLWSEDMADASVHVLLNVNFSDIIGIEKYSSVFYGTETNGQNDRNSNAGRGGAIPALGEIRNCHINVGTGKGNYYLKNWLYSLQKLLILKVKYNSIQVNLMARHAS